MKALSGKLSEAYASWTSAISQCCISLTNRNDEKLEYPEPCGEFTRRSSSYLTLSYQILDEEKSFAVIRDEPSFIPPHNMVLFRAPKERPTEERAPRKRSHRSKWSSFSVRSRLPANASSRRPLISGPTNFRHLYSESFRFPAELSQTGPRPSPFQPLELNIHSRDKQLSPILPHFEYPNPPVTPPPRAITHSSPSDGGHSVSHQRSCSSMSFHIPRRPIPGGSVFDSPRSNSSTPQRPPPARVRAYTSSESPSTIMEDLVERVASAMLERDKIQEQIDDVLERQSIYISSRPSTAYGQPGMCLYGIGYLVRYINILLEMEPMPDIPALPPDAPSFSERLSTDRPRTAPPRTPTRVAYQANSSRKVEGRVPPPPLPLRLRPPLRKKKSFSRVSTWLFPGGEHKRDISLDSITNLPKPVTGAEGFYQVAQPSPSRRSSFETVPTVSDWSAEEQTIPTSWSPSSNETSKACVRKPISSAFERRDPFVRPQGRSVGIAF